ncbi:MAG: hypothetical protein KGQ42_06290 [Alphaproteobacteria bacterium]|nr:hypothetical protein [Alphaproteobacteria bacterium]MDE2042089.1 hypothetical protein [Alphaproteobacteria bacterium]MDE2341440.1 hypothetical protein [Alphaproteobacteria bacterium]
MSGRLPAAVPPSSPAARHEGVPDADLRKAIAHFAPVKRADRAAGWSAEKQRNFIQVLMTTGSVTHACKAVGMARQNAYLLRYCEGAESFAIAWDAAMRLAAQRLVDIAYERVLEGEVIPHFYRGEQVGERIKYDNKLLMQLLRTQNKRRFGRVADIQGYYEGDQQIEARIEIGAQMMRFKSDAEGDEAPVKSLGEGTRPSP